MKLSQQINESGILCRATKRQRFRSIFILLGISIFFVLTGLGAAGKINIERLSSPCGFEQKYGLPCPTCGITRAVLAFAGGRFLEAFYIQPAGALFCSLAVIGAFLAFLTAVFGVYFRFLSRFFADIKFWYIILGLLIIICAGWTITLARVLLIDY
jgi:hypothetical protein